MKKWICRTTSRPASQSSHCESLSWISAASENGSSGLSAIDAHTMISHAMTNSSSSRTRSHSDIRLRVAAFGLRCGLHRGRRRRGAGGVGDRRGHSFSSTVNDDTTLVISFWRC